MGARGALLLGLLALTGCRTVAPAAASRAPVEVVAVAAAFPGPDRGELALTLEVGNPQGEAGTVTRVTWELWLGGRWFAAGIGGVQTPVAAGQRQKVELTLPLVFRRLEVQPEPTSLQVGVRGAVELSFGASSVRLPFEATRRIVADGAPVLSGLGEDE